MTTGIDDVDPKVVEGAFWAGVLVGATMMAWAFWEAAARRRELELRRLQFLADLREIDRRAAVAEAVVVRGPTEEPTH